MVSRPASHGQGAAARSQCSGRRPRGGHFDHIGRKHDVDLEPDCRETLRSAHVSRDLIEDWDLQLDAQRTRHDLASRPGPQVPRLIHKLVLSMPVGPPETVLGAASSLCREEFALKHGYAMAPYTGQPHPHVISCSGP